MPENKIQYNQGITKSYESLSVLTGEMRIAAVQGEWDRLVALEQQCRQHVTNIQAADEISQPDEATRQQIVQLIRKILADDAEIRTRTENWMAQLQHVMQSTRQELRLNQTYGAM